MWSLTNLFVFSLVIISTHCSVSVHNPFYCYSEDPIRQWTGLGGILSPYEPNRGKHIHANVSTCNPSKFWMAARHGARLPASDVFPDLFRVIPALHGQILTNYNQGRTWLCASDFELLRNWHWNPNITADNMGILSDSGWNEMEALAQRYQSAFPTLLPSIYSRNHYYFRSSNFHRTRHSLNAFADGLFGINGHEQVQFEDIPEPDLYMRPIFHCPLYSDVNRIRTEQDAFIQGPEYQEMVTQISAKLGFHHSNVLRTNEVALLALYCQYEQTWNINYTYPSPFCASFSVSNAQVFEYSHDVDWYYRLGYGRPEYRRLYENLNCFLLQDMLRFIQSNDINDHTARIFTGHIHLFIMFLNFEAFDGDAPMTRHNFAQQTQRVWRSNENFPTAANLAVIRYDCADSDNDLLFLFNEKPFPIPGCDSNGVCKKSLILERLGRYLNANCLETYCTNT